MTRLIAIVALLGACTTADENPIVHKAEDTRCGPAARFVTGACTELGDDDRCVDHDDVCIALCDGLTSCRRVDEPLRPLDPWPVAPDGWCVVCLD